MERVTDSLPGAELGEARGSLCHPQGQCWSSRNQPGHCWGAEGTPEPLTANLALTFRSRSGFFFKTWTNSVTSICLFPGTSVARAAVLGWSCLAWPGTGKVSSEIWTHFCKAHENHLVKRQLSTAIWGG